MNNRSYYIRQIIEQAMPDRTDEGKGGAIAGAGAVGGAGYLLYKALQGAHGVGKSGLGQVGKAALRRKLQLDNIE